MPTLSILRVLVALALPLLVTNATAAEPEAEPTAEEATESAALTLIVHPSVELESIKAKDAKRYYIGSKQTWKAGERVVLFRLPDAAPASALLMDETLNMSAPRFHAQWQQKLLSGAGVAPNKVDSTEAMLQAVASTPGSLGYVLRSEVPEDGSVRILPFAE